MTETLCLMLRAPYFYSDSFLAEGRTANLKARDSSPLAPPQSGELDLSRACQLPLRGRGGMYQVDDLHAGPGGHRKVDVIMRLDL